MLILFWLFCFVLRLTRQPFAVFLRRMWIWFYIHVCPLCRGEWLTYDLNGAYASSCACSSPNGISVSNEVNVWTTHHAYTYSNIQWANKFSTNESYLLVFIWMRLRWVHKMANIIIWLAPFFFKDVCDITHSLFGLAYDNNEVWCDGSQWIEWSCQFNAFIEKFMTSQTSWPKANGNTYIVCMSWCFSIKATIC